MGVFQFKQFDVDDSACAMKVCSDSVILGAWFVPPHSHASRILDIGTGSGILALMCAQQCPQAVIEAVELDSEAAKCAASNFARSPWADRLCVTCSDFALHRPTHPLDLIICNPPYFATGEKAPQAQRAVARHQDGLSYNSLMQYAARHLTPDGHLGVVAPADLLDDIIMSATMARLNLRRILHVTSTPRKAPNRVYLDFSPTDGPMENQSMSIRKPDGSYTDDYINLVNPFYTKI